MSYCKKWVIGLVLTAGTLFVVPTSAEPAPHHHGHHHGGHGGHSGYGGYVAGTAAKVGTGVTEDTAAMAETTRACTRTTATPTGIRTETSTVTRKGTIRAVIAGKTSALGK